MNGNKPPLLWLNITIFSLSLIVALVVTPWYGINYGIGWEHFFWCLAAFSFTNLSITAGYHRLWSHKTYEAHSSLKVLFALGGAFALQNSALHWSADHRVHHKHVDDNDKDPYSAKRGFWFSHIGWMLRDYNHSHQSDYKNCRDLKKDKVVMWQHKYYVLLAIATNLLIPLAAGLIHGDIVGMFLIVCIVRLVLSHHTTFFINSLAHVWGKQTFTDKNTARDNAFLAVLTFGEGYHNFHHIFENDYRNGVSWWHYDPTKWLIKSLSWFGLTSKLRTTPSLRIEKAKLSQQQKKAEKALERSTINKVCIEELRAEFDELIQKMQCYYDTKKQFLDDKKANATKAYENAVLKVRYQQAKLELKLQKQQWNKRLKLAM